MSEHIPANYNPRDFPQNVKLAADLLAEKIRENGSLREGVRAYNGSKHNPKAQAYREKVFREAAKV
jgi:hypothetical protein